MNYYEELGLTPEATTDEVRRAYRTLSKLMHPDAQTDESVRRLAEMQMRRLNTIVATLTDDEKRKQYDKEIKSAFLERRAATDYNIPLPEEQSPSRLRVLAIRTWKALPWWVWSTAGAMALTSAAVYFWAGNVGSSFGNPTMAYVPASDTVPTKTSQPAPPKKPEPAPVINSGDTSDQRRRALEPEPTATRKETARESAQSKVKEKSASRKDGRTQQRQAEQSQDSQPEPSQNPGSVDASTSASHQSPPIEVARLAPPSVEQIPAPPPAIPLTSIPQQAPQSPSKEASPSSSGQSEFVIEGDWIYAPDKPEPTKPGLFPPSFIEMKIYRTSGQWRGVYHARYQVEDRPVDPNVNFLLSGSDTDAKKFNWESPNGSKGTLKIKRLNDSTIKVEWETKTYSAQHVLTSGIATLNKR